MRTLPLREARDQLGELINRAVHGHEVTAITRYGQPAAVVISTDDYLKLLYGAAAERREQGFALRMTAEEFIERSRLSEVKKAELRRVDGVAER
jgi:prevent-host-death family protein